MIPERLCLICHRPITALVRKKYCLLCRWYAAAEWVKK